ncbi:hypothetical protein [Saccharospirillum mangrovi]|uniref:hypothetical protein n=1 Tax=Saccharospirillum mangrovi TaxID=2161747 RepID=UPI000D3864F0|nr:hypothetical protein [Saccharospirillum mangrovi]
MWVNLIVLFAVLTLAGAVMWLRPNAHDRRLGKVRSAALAQGFKLYSLAVPDTSVDGRVGGKRELRTLYRLLHAFSRDQAPAFTVLRTSGVASAYLPEGWVWADDQRVRESHRDALASFLSQLPEHYSVVDAQADGIGVCWDESRVEQLPEVRETLQRLASILSR